MDNKLINLNFLKMKLLKPTVLALLVALFFGCEKDSVNTENQSNDFEKRINRSLSNMDVGIIANANGRSSESTEAWMASLNETISEYGIQLDQIEYYGADGAGNTVYFNDRGNRQLGADFVPGDARRGGFFDIAYARDGTEGATSSGLSQAQTDDAILSAMNTWDNVSCSEGLDLFDLGSSPFDLGYVAFLIGAGGAPVFTDVMHSGFNTNVTDAVFGVGSNVLAVTFTFIWVDAGGPTDIDNNGKTDVAFRDIYYNDAFAWAIGDNIDVETVALHEAGHGLSQGHFGKLFQSGGNGQFHFAPRAVMNAGYTGVQNSIGETDNAGHCSIWDEWPNN